MLTNLFGKRGEPEEAAKTAKSKKIRGTHLKGYGGRVSRSVRESRIQRILLAMYWFHCLTPSVLIEVAGAKKIALFGAKKPRTGTGDKKNGGLMGHLEGIGLVKTAKTHVTMAAPEGIVWLLTEDGAHLVVKNWGWSYDNEEKWPHAYSSSVEKISHNQLAHDMTIARWAAYLVRKHDAVVLDTDYSARSDPDAQEGRKIVDLRYRVNHNVFTVEYERTMKSQREIEIALVGLLDYGTVTVVVCASPDILKRWRKILASDHLPVWEKNSVTRKWYRTSGVIEVSPNDRKLVTLLDEDTAELWLDEKAAQAWRIQ